MIEIGKVMPFLGGGNEAGALKLTIQKFYRVAGGSTQLKGVLPDVKLPSVTDHPEIGEGAMKGPLNYDTVDSVPFERWSIPLPKTELAQRSTARIANDAEFKYIAEDTATVQKRLTDNRLSLNLEQRKKEIDEEKARKEARKAARAQAKPPEEKRFTLTLDNVAAAELQPYEEKKPEKIKLDDDADDDAEDETPARTVDAIRNETVNILRDLIELTHGAKTAQAAPAK